MGNQLIEFSAVFNYDLAPVPTLMFQDSGETKYSKTKSVLKNKLNVEVPMREKQAELVFIDRGGMFHSAVY